MFNGSDLRGFVYSCSCNYLSLLGVSYHVPWFTMKNFSWFTCFFLLCKSNFWKGAFKSPAKLFWNLLIYLGDSLNSTQSQTNTFKGVPFACSRKVIKTSIHSWTNYLRQTLVKQKSDQKQYTIIDEIFETTLILVVVSTKF